MDDQPQSINTSKRPRNFLEKAWDDVVGLDMKQLAKNASADFIDDSSVVVRFFLEKFVINKKKKSVTRLENDKKISSFISALILHYLIGAKEIEPTGKLLTFRELEGGEVYYQAFYRRAIQPIAQELAPTPELLLKRAKRIGGVKHNLGDASTKISVFPRLPIIVVIWMGDDEVPSSANILFDSTAGYHLSTEDLAAIGDIVADSLVLLDDEWRGW